MAAARRSHRFGRVGFTAALSRVWYWALLVGLYGLLPIWVAPPDWADELDFGPVVDTVLGFAIGFVLVMRINQAYERWWEARTLWGWLVNASRNLALKARELADLDAEEQADVARLIVGFADALKAHLRHGAVLQEVPGFENETDTPVHVPSHLAGRLYDRIAVWEKSGRITPQALWMLDQELREFMQVAGGCEKIKNTLMAQSFPTLVRQAIFIYLVYLPWSIEPEFGLLTVPLSIGLSYFVIAAEGIAYYVERPFGKDDDHLDLEEICDGIRASVKEILS